MEITIGILGPQDTVKGVLTFGKKHFANISFIPLVYETHHQIPDLVKNSFSIVDCLLFTGITPYSIAKSQIDFPFTVEYIPREVNLLYKILLDIIYTQKLDGIVGLSIDTYSEEEISEFVEELPLPIDNYYVLEDSSQKNQVQNFHEQLYEQGKVDICLTTTLEPYISLQEKGVPIRRILPTSASIKKAIEILLLKIKSERSHSAQISIGIINIDNFKNVVKNRPSEYHIQKIKLKLQELLLDYCEETYSTLIFNGNDEFLIFTTIGSLKSFGENYDGTIVKTIKEKLNITVSYGLGLGYTAIEAMHNARIALEHAKINGGYCAYLRQIDTTIIGPLNSEKKKHHDINPTIIHQLSQVVNIVPSTLNKVLDTMLAMNKNTFDAKEFSQNYGCTIRTAHRILSALDKERIVEILAYDQEYDKGRPRRIYQFNPEKIHP